LLVSSAIRPSSFRFESFFFRSTVLPSVFTFSCADTSVRLASCPPSIFIRYRRALPGILRRGALCPLHFFLPVGPFDGRLLFCWMDRPFPLPDIQSPDLRRRTSISPSVPLFLSWVFPFLGPGLVLLFRLETFGLCRLPLLSLLPPQRILFVENTCAIFSFFVPPGSLFLFFCMSLPLPFFVRPPLPPSFFSLCLCLPPGSPFDRHPFYPSLYGPPGLPRLRRTTSHLNSSRSLPFFHQSCGTAHLSNTVSS